MIATVIRHPNPISPGRVRCRYCGQPKDRGLTECQGCGARWTRRINRVGWVMIGSLVLLPLFLVLRLAAPDLVAPKRWKPY